MKSAATASVSLSDVQSCPPPTDFNAPEALETLFAKAESSNASDIHLQMLPSEAQIMFRLDGVLAACHRIPREPAERLFGRIKFLAKLKTYQESIPQDGRIEKGDVGSQADIRVATYPTVTGEKIVLRLFSATKMLLLEELGFDLNTLQELSAFLRQTSGLLLLTGPAGSGKTATIYACLRELARMGGRHIITVEDPAEQIIPGVMQTEVNEARGLDFAKAARHLLRQDPQVLVLGEIRDDETAAIAVRAALTGHLVISTLHAGSCAGVFERLFAFCPDASAIGSAAQLILNQRLVRKVCPSCHGSRCEECLHTGYRGRIPLAEHLSITPQQRKRIAVRDWDSFDVHPNLLECAAKLVEEGVTDRAEINRVLGF